MKDLMNQVAEFKEIHNEKEIKLGETYWVSEWSWTPLYDGYKEYEAVIRNVEVINGYNVYTTGKNYRHYFAWDICQTKEEAKEISKIKDSYAYDWPMKVDSGLIEGSMVLGKLK